MPYYPTLAEDVARAKEILERGKAEPLDLPPHEAHNIKVDGGTIYGADTYAAYKLLESFVAAIEAVGPKVCELALRHRQKSADVWDGDCLCRTRGCGHAARLHVGGICQACACDGWS